MNGIKNASQLYNYLVMNNFENKNKIHHKFNRIFNPFTKYYSASNQMNQAYITKPKKQLKSFITIFNICKIFIKLESLIPI